LAARFKGGIEIKILGTILFSLCHLGLYHLFTSLIADLTSRHKWSFLPKP